MVLSNFACLPEVVQKQIFGTVVLHVNIDQMSLFFFLFFFFVQLACSDFSQNEVSVFQYSFLDQAVYLSVDLPIKIWRS